MGFSDSVLESHTHRSFENNTLRFIIDLHGLDAGPKIRYMRGHPIGFQFVGAEGSTNQKGVILCGENSIVGEGQPTSWLIPPSYASPNHAAVSIVDVQYWYCILVRLPTCFRESRIHGHIPGIKFGATFKDRHVFAGNGSYYLIFNSLSDFQRGSNESWCPWSASGRNLRRFPSRWKCICDLYFWRIRG